jgi:spermidine synthase
MALSIALALLSAAVLAHEVALVHLFSILHWTHFAALVIGLALLGFGASGSAVAVVSRRGGLAGRERPAFVAATALAALTFDPTYRLATAIPFDAFELIAVPRQILYLALTWVVLGAPFFFAGTAVTLAFLISPDRIGRTYAANLAGSGAGSLLGLALVATLPAARLPVAVGAIAGMALVPLVRWDGGRRAGILVAAAAGAAIALAFLPPPPVLMSSYKEERLALELPGARVLSRRDGPLGRLDVVAAPALRYLPGTSLALDRPVPPRPVLYLNGEPLGPRALAADTSLLGQTTAAAAFAIGRGEPSEVLILGLGGGGSIHLARASGAGSITVVDPDRRIDPLLAPGTLGPDVRRSATTARAFLHAAEHRYDRILVAETGSLHGAAGGMAAAGASYLFTVEGMADLFEALGQDGVLAITRWAIQPPREVPRLLATLRTVLDARSLPAGPRVMLVRSWGTATLLASPRPFTPDEVGRLADWAAARSFDLAWAPGAPASAANRYNVLDPDWFRMAAEGLLGPTPGRFLAGYPFAVDPVTDERPFYHHFLPLGRLLELWRSGGRLSLPYLEWGLLAQALVFVQAVPISALLILLPLLFLPREAVRSGGRPPRDERRPARFVYFALLGVAFMLLEVSSIQRFLLFLAEPVTATSVVLAAFLVFAGLGSLTAGRLRTTGRFRSPWLPFLAIAALAPLTWLGGQALWEAFAGSPLAVRMALALGLLAPLAFCMGMPFPLGLQRVADTQPEWIPWCWGVNGFLSVVGAAAAPLVALAIGFRGVLLLAAAVYLLAGWTLRRL